MGKLHMGQHKAVGLHIAVGESRTTLALLRNKLRNFHSVGVLNNDVLLLPADPFSPGD
jgi:hypothetical protein